MYQVPSTVPEGSSALRAEPALSCDPVAAPWSSITRLAPPLELPPASEAPPPLDALLPLPVFVDPLDDPLPVLVLPEPLFDELLPPPPLLLLLLEQAASQAKPQVPARTTAKDICFFMERSLSRVITRRRFAPLTDSRSPRETRHGRPHPEFAALISESRRGRRGFGS